MESSFNPKQQEKEVSSKIVAGLERISEVYKILLWEKAKQVKLSPIQIQILIFIAYHSKNLCNVSHFAKEFNVTKPTISDAVKVLNNKELVFKDFSSSDNRRYTLQLTDLGLAMVSKTEDFALPLKKQINKLNEDKLNSLFGTINELIFKLNSSGILNVQRTCFGCKYYQNINGDYCNLLQKELKPTEIRLDCPEFEEKA